VQAAVAEAAGLLAMRSGAIWTALDDCMDRIRALEGGVRRQGQGQGPGSGPGQGAALGPGAVKDDDGAGLPAPPTPPTAVNGSPSHDSKNSAAAAAGAGAAAGGGSGTARLQAMLKKPVYTFSPLSSRMVPLIECYFRAVSVAGGAAGAWAPFGAPGTTPLPTPAAQLARAPSAAAAAAAAAVPPRATEPLALALPGAEGAASGELPTTPSSPSTKLLKRLASISPTRAPSLRHAYPPALPTPDAGAEDPPAAALRNERARALHFAEKNRALLNGMLRRNVRLLDAGNSLAPLLLLPELSRKVTKPHRDPLFDPPPCLPCPHL